MRTRFSTIKLRKLSRLITQRTGIQIPEERLQDIDHAVMVISREFDFPTIEACFEWLSHDQLSPSQIKILAKHITVGETYFYRDDTFFSVLTQSIFPQLLESHNISQCRLKIWSAACSTGEEPYTIAILLKELFSHVNQEVISILGTDINLNFLKKARTGVFRPWSFRSCPPWFKKYFDQDSEGNLTIHDDINNMVQFEYLNLAEDIYPTDKNDTDQLDLIVCRNALMYLEPDAAQQVIERFYQALNPNGWLALGGCENGLPTAQFQPVFFDRVVMFKKLSRKSRSKPDTQHSFPTSVGDGSTSRLPAIQQDAAPKAKQQPAQIQSPLADDNTYQKAHQFYEQGHYEKAQTLLMELVEDTATAQESAATDLSPILLLLTRICANQGRKDEALYWCEQLIAADKLNPSPYLLQATILMENNEPKQAVEPLRQALYLDPDFILAHFLIGNIMRSLGKKAIARKHYRNTLNILNQLDDHDILAESEGISAGSLKNYISTMLGPHGNNTVCSDDRKNDLILGN